MTQPVHTYRSDQPAPRLASMQRCCHSAISAASQTIDLGPMGIGAGKMPAFTLRQIVARDHPVALITSAKRRNVLVVVIVAPVIPENGNK